MTDALLEIETDVLVAGGGPAGAWAALRAADAGADVVLVDKGWCGASGATAAAGTGVWYVEPDPAAREAAMASREALGGYLADRGWMTRVLDETYDGMNELADRGRYPFPVDDDGHQIRRGVQGPEYMRRMRVLVRRAGVRILDHSPLLELLTDAEGAVVGAAGQRRQAGGDYRVRAGAVVLATGGSAFASGALGTHVDTGDGTLAAAEVGAHLSGMEFSNAYAIAPAHSSVTKTAYYSYASFYRADGSVLEGAGSTRGRSVIARTLLTEPVLARLDHAGPAERAAMRRGQPNFFLAFDRAGIDPFTDRFPITLLAEGTVRGTGGIALASTSCDTDVPGLYAAGDVATREYICGGFTGGGSHNAAWALSSGSWAGRAAARHARTVRGLGGFGRARPATSRRRGQAPGRRRGHHCPRGGPRGAGRGPALRPELPAPRRPAGPGARATGRALARAAHGPGRRRALAGPRGRRDDRGRALDVHRRPGPRRVARDAQARGPARQRPGLAPPPRRRGPGRGLDPADRTGGGGVIEIVSAERCIRCDRCVDVCPTDVFDRGPSGVPVVARQADCQTCFLCEAWCPVDALFVAPSAIRCPRVSTRPRSG